MKEKRQISGRIMAVLVAVMLCITGLTVVLTSCQLLEQADQSTAGDGNNAQKDAYESKLIYCEAQIQSLTTQLGQMEQQMYVMRNDYIDQLQQLQQQLTQQPTTGEPDGEEGDADDEEDEGDGEVATPPTQDNDGEEESRPPDDTPSGEIVLCEYTYRLENNCAILTGYTGQARDVIVPAAVDGHLVIALDDRVFADSNVRSVILPKTVETLGWFTFYQCRDLQRVVLPAGVRNIGYASFDGCSSLLCLYVEAGSYAEQFADSFGLKYQRQS